MPRYTLTRHHSSHWSRIRRTVRKATTAAIVFVTPLTSTVKTADATHQPRRVTALPTLTGPRATNSDQDSELASAIAALDPFQASLAPRAVALHHAIKTRANALNTPTLTVECA